MSVRDNVVHDKDHLLQQRALWRRQVTTMPALHGGKHARFRLLLELVTQIRASDFVALDSRPDLPPSIFDTGHAPRGAAPLTEPSTWQDYGRALKSLGLASATQSGIELTETGLAFLENPSRVLLGQQLAQRLRLFAETLAYISGQPRNIEDVHSYLSEKYGQTGRTKQFTRDRVDWLDALDLIEAIPSRQWVATPAGVAFLSTCLLVTPDALATQSSAARTVIEPPAEIATLLHSLESAERTHESRSTYNLWVPSPASDPNKVENLRTIANAALDPITREEFLGFIASRFGLSRSSVESMMPFLRASGLILEVSLGVYQTTLLAQVWLTSNDDLNFIRILHAHMRFVGEILEYAKVETPRNEIYTEAARYGLNKEKCRWIISFLADVDLLDYPRYGSVRTSPTGALLVTELPLAPPTNAEQDSDAGETSTDPPSQQVTLQTLGILSALSEKPNGGNLSQGRAFEEAIQYAFQTMGFNAHTVGGSGDTDIVVIWRDKSGASVTAVVEAKSRSSGQVSHVDVSDVAIETHRKKNGAKFAAIVGPHFSGSTIRNIAKERAWTLLTASDLDAIVEEVTHLGIAPYLAGQLFEVPDGLERLRTEIQLQKRQLAVLTFVIAQLSEEASETGDALTARDMSRDGRRTELQPTIDEVLDALETLTISAPEAVRIIQENSDPKHVTYSLGYVQPAAARLRALAKALETH